MRYIAHGLKLENYKPRKGQIFGPKFRGGIPRELIRRFGPDDPGQPEARCQKELANVMTAMAAKDDHDIPFMHGELAEALLNCMKSETKRGAKPATNYHIFRAIRPRK
mmetsp:Transcript_1354/g.1797  ORF Transcript_1354/g.1797 Transcript_1354/m.1797 type:complete len:108 (+) Transcript_1354:91-414(+)